MHAPAIHVHKTVYVLTSAASELTLHAQQQLLVGAKASTPGFTFPSLDKSKITQPQQVPITDCWRLARQRMVATSGSKSRGQSVPQVPAWSGQCDGWLPKPARSDARNWMQDGLQCSQSVVQVHHNPKVEV
jgi:hypothetical protein